MTKTILVTSANSAYLGFAQDLIDSLRGLTFQHPFDIGFLDIGLEPPQRTALEKEGVKVVSTTPHIPHPLLKEAEKTNPGFRTLSERLFMRDYFPDYDVYVWMDADAWAQTPEGIDLMIEGASRSSAMQVCYEIDRSYHVLFDNAAIWRLYHDWYQTNFGKETAEAMSLKPMANAGIWAMAKDLPVWQAWIDHYTASLNRFHDVSGKSFMADQLGLNILLQLHKKPHKLLPATCNWLTFFALPMYDGERKLFVEPNPPYAPLSNIHLTRGLKHQAEKIKCTNGREIETSLTYRGWKMLHAASS